MVRAKRGMEVRELRSASRRHQVVQARHALASLAIKEYGYSGAEVARFFDVTTSCMTRPLVTATRPTRKRATKRQAICVRISLKRFIVCAAHKSHGVAWEGPRAMDA